MHSRIFTTVLLMCLLPLACNKRPDSDKSKAETAKSAWKLPDEIARKLEALRKAGEPTTVEEMRRWYEAPLLATNAAPLYANAFSLLPGYDSPGGSFLSDGISNLPRRNAPMPKATRDELAKFCAESADLFNALRVASQVKECRYALQFSDDLVSTPMHHMSNVRRCSNAMRVYCYWFIETGQIDRALDSLCDQIALAESLARDPFLIAQLIRGACLSQSELTLERLLNRRKLTLAQIDRLEQTLASVNLREGFRRSLSAERCQAIIICQFPVDGLKEILGGMSINELLAKISDSQFGNTSRAAAPEFDLEAYRDSATYGRDFLLALENFEILIKAVETPFPEALTIAREFATNVSIAFTNGYVFTSLMTPSLRDVVVGKYAQGEAHLRVMRAALGIERMRLSSAGRLPDSADAPVILSELSGLTDPFDGKAIRYKRRAPNSYVVYSIGPDEKDDGGIPREESKDKTAYDLVFIVTR